MSRRKSKGGSPAGMWILDGRDPAWDRKVAQLKTMTDNIDAACAKDREREGENLCRQCGLNKYEECECRCSECGANTHPVYKCAACMPEEHARESARLEQEKREYYEMVADRGGVP